MEEGGSFEAAYREHITRAVRLAYLLTGDAELAQDLAHDAFLRLFTRFRDLRKPDAFGTYLRRTVVNLTRDHYRRRLLHRRFERAGAAPESHEDEPDTGLRGDLWRALRGLPHRQRSAVVLRYYEDLSEAQVADVLACSHAAAKSLIARGVGRLRTYVKQKELS